MPIVELDLAGAALIFAASNFAGADAPGETGSADSDQSTSSRAATSQANPGPAPSRVDEIIVTAQRLPADRVVEPDKIGTFGVGTIAELVDEIAAQDGDSDAPFVIVNGERIEDFGDVSDLPPEAVERVEVLPRGSAATYGGPPGGRAYNVVLKKSFRSGILSAGSRLTTEGGGRSNEGSASFTRIAGPNRLNLAFDVSNENALYESERSIVQPEPRFPYDTRGNIIGINGGEIDSALSAIAGRTVTLAGVPDAARPGLADFAATAGKPRVTDLGRFRTLLPDTQLYKLSAALNHRLGERLMLSANGRFEWSDRRYEFGLPAGLVRLPAGNQFSPFSQDVLVARYIAQPLAQTSREFRGSLSTTLTRTIGTWQLAFGGRYEENNRRALTDREVNSSTNPVLLTDPSRDPFGALEDQFPLREDLARSRLSLVNTRTTLSGPAFRLPAGPVNVTLSAGWTRSKTTATRFGMAPDDLDRFVRTEWGGEGTVSVPILGRGDGAPSWPGNLSASLSGGVSKPSDAVTVTRWETALNWAPVRALRFTAARGTIEQPPLINLLNEPVITTSGVRYFDFVTGETVDVTQISGGNPDLAGTRTVNRRLGAEFTAVQAINLRVTVDHILARLENPVAGLPPASLDLLLAFPDRFVRNADGRLVRVDVRPVNFVAQRSEQLRWGLSFALPPRPVSGTAPPSVARGPTTRPRVTPLKVQFDLAHTINLANEVVVRDGFPTVDLLDGGATGFGGSLPRHMVNGSVNLGNSLGGLRVSANWRDGSTLRQGSGGTSDELDLAGFAVVNLRGHLDLGAIWPEERWLKSSRFSLAIANVMNKRQAVTDRAGNTPLRFQPAYRDALGRTVSIEFRRSF